VQAIKELALESPFELGMVKVAGVELEIISMHGDVRILELDNDFDTFALTAGRKVEEGMLVEAELAKYSVEPSIKRFWHGMILIETAMNDLTTENTEDTERFR
jgi:hypothetical protein